MPLNPTLKNALVRATYIVGSLLAVLILFIWSPIGEHHKTLTGIWQFVITLAIIWLNRYNSLQLECTYSYLR